MKREKTAITLIKFCIPLILSGILQQLYNWADAFIVGNVAGENALAAIGSTTTVINLFLGCIFLLVPAAGIPGAYPLLRIMNTTPETIHMAKNYLQIILIGLPFLAVYNVYTSALRGIGNSRAPFGSVLCSSVVNVVLDLIFVGMMHWGAAGAAAATVISQMVMTVFIILYSVKNYPCLCFSIKKWTMDHAVLKEGLHHTPAGHQSRLRHIYNGRTESRSRKKRADF